ncbi:kinase-like protein [Westerdykella ornata]|uniref:Kinase-like protein n=1 Tax=Westerdykella ornata TaxID=318751 RepID=A0A6A6JNR7_WESOR|nr:kinase-like protein [Westerdykella ornata]KAF2278162.1 kinase-like protein [Westerdykella ornata]
MALRIGPTLRGGKGKYELLEQLKGSTAFKARVVSSHSPKQNGMSFCIEVFHESTAYYFFRAVVKSAITNDEIFTLKREYRNYQKVEIASRPHIRTPYDVVWPNDTQEDQLHLLFEWMDRDLRLVPANVFRGDQRLPRAVSKAVLSALIIFKQLNVVHTGNLVSEGSTQCVQSLPCRAPEVWQGLGCQHRSDVWSLGVTLVHSLSPQTIFGPRDKIIEGFTEAWCIAKIIRLLSPRLSDPPVLPQLMNFIEYLLVVDPSKRPMASEALLHPYLQSSP